MVVCCATQVRANYVSIITETPKSRFSCIHNSVIFHLMNAKVAVEVPAYQGRQYTKFEENQRKPFPRYE